ncbi:hypothetical protein [Erwinia amylovora]|uniref:hypothetical protein n=1 Tax=Erwinia amylovora TaxID=552 RepID=UPI0011779808|nr:hypothetical protein [Erwinia amylovora]
MTLFACCKFSGIDSITTASQAGLRQHQQQKVQLKVTFIQILSPFGLGMMDQAYRTGFLTIANERYSQESSFLLSPGARYRFGTIRWRVFNQPIRPVNSLASILLYSGKFCVKLLNAQR